MNLKPRAEDYTDKEVLEMKSYTYFPYNNFKKLLIIGDRGIGKTFSIRHSLLTQKQNAKLYVFRKNKKIELLYDEGNDIIIYDDIHYLCESVLQGETNIDVLLEIFRRICNEENKVILISDSPLCFYAEKLNSPEFNELIKNIGEYLNSYKTDRSNVDFLARKEFGRISDAGVMDIAIGIDKKIDREILLYLLKMQITPREIINFINLFDGDVTYKKVIEKSHATDKDMNILNQQKIPCEVKERDVILNLSKKFKRYEDFRGYIKYFENLRHDIINKFQSDIEILSTLYPHLFQKNKRSILSKKIIELLNKKDILGIEEQWYLMDRYYKLLKNMESKGKYKGDLNLFTGWKGNYYKQFKELKDLSVSERISLWSNKKRCHVCNEEECIIPVLQKRYEKKYQEYPRIKELRKVVIEGKYHYEK